MMSAEKRVSYFRPVLGIVVLISLPVLVYSCADVGGVTATYHTLHSSMVHNLTTVINTYYSTIWFFCVIS